MADLRAAAKRLRGGDWTTPSQDKADRFLAAQALEALAWMEENGRRLEYEDAVRWSSGETTWRQVERGAEGSWCCMNDLFTRYYAATPLAAILAAKEGEDAG
jgi:hypothetical protein